MHQSSVHKYEHLPFHVEIRWLNVKTLHGTAAQRLLQVSLQDLSTVVSPPPPSPPVLLSLAPHSGILIQQ